MGLKVDGYGALPAQLAQALQPRESDLEAVLNVPLGRVEIPKKKTELQRMAAELDRQIDVLKQHEDQSSDPKVKADVRHLMTVAREARLDVESRLLSWAVSAVDQRPAGAPKLDSNEAAAIFALFGQTFSNGEMEHALGVLDAHLADADRKLHVHSLADATAARADNVGRRTSRKSRGVFAARVVPVLAGLGGARALGQLMNLEPAVGLAVNLAAIQMGFQVGQRTGAQSVKNAAFVFGVGRFEGEVDHDLGLMHDRLTKLEFRMWKLGEEEGPKALQQDIALIKMLCGKRRETWPGRDVSATEKQAVTTFERWADRLQEAGFEGARGGIKAKDLGLQRAALEKIPSLPALAAAQPVDQTRSVEAFRTVLAEAAKGCLAVTNMPLRRLITVIEAKHLAAGTELSAGEAEALRRFVGDSPNVSEVFALGRLAAAGVVDLGGLWPAGNVLDIEGNRLEPEAAKELFATLGDRSKGASIERLGRAVGVIAPFFAAGAAYLGASALGDPGITSVMGAVSLFGALGASMATHIAGLFLGNRLQRKGATTKLMQGIDVAQALGNEYALMLPRLMDPEMMLAGSLTEAKQRLNSEADVLDVVIGSVQSSQQNLRTALAELEAGGEPKDPQEAASRQVLGEMLERFAASKQVHYDALSAVRDELRRVGGEADSQDALREGFAEVRQELYGLVPATWADIVFSQTQQEFSPDAARYFKAKSDLVDALKGWDGKAVPEGLQHLSEQLAPMYEAIPKTNRPKKDDLDKVAAKVSTKPEKVDRGRLAQVKSEGYAKGLAQTRLDTLSIGEARAEEIGQEVLNALWSQLYPTYGLVPDDLATKMPKLQGARVTAIPAQEPGGFGTYKVEGRVDGAGRLEVVMDAAGRISGSPDQLVIDLGARRLGRMAEEALRHHLAAATGAEPTQVHAQLGSRDDEGTCTFDVRAGDRAFSVRIGAQGYLDNGAINEK